MQQCSMTSTIFSSCFLDSVQVQNTTHTLNMLRSASSALKFTQIVSLVDLQHRDHSRHPTSGHLKCKDCSDQAH